MCGLMAITWLRLLEQKRVWHYYILPTTLSTTTTTTKPFVPSIWGRLHERKENYTGSGTWISFLHSFLSSNLPLLRPLASISCKILNLGYRDRIGWGFFISDIEGDIGDTCAYRAFISDTIYNEILITKSCLVS